MKKDRFDPLIQAINRLADSQAEIAKAIVRLTERQRSFTTAPVQPADSRPQGTHPEFIRMPNNRHACPYTGLSRSFLYGLATEGKIRTVSLRRRGAVRGVRLIDLDSLLSYIRESSAGSGEILAERTKN